MTEPLAAQVEHVTDRVAVTAGGTRTVPPAGRRPPARRRRPARPPQRNPARAWLLLLPALVALGGLLLVPLARVVVISFQDMSGLRALARGGGEFVGFDNYKQVLGSRQLWQTVLPNTVVVAVLCVVLTVIVGTLAALLLESLRPRARALVTMAILTAWAVPAVTGTYIWVWTFNPTDGLVSEAAQALGLVDPGGENWFTNRYAFFAIVIVNVVHHGFPFVALTVLAGLLTVPAELTEAAVLDGASAWRRFWTITVPLLKPVFAVVTILSTIWDFKVFAQVYLMPGGDGANRDVLNLGTWSYVEAFGQTEFGLGSAIAVVLTLTLLLITAVYLRTLFREGELA